MEPDDARPRHGGGVQQVGRNCGRSVLVAAEREDLLELVHDQYQARAASEHRALHRRIARCRACSSCPKMLH